MGSDVSLTNLAFRMAVLNRSSLRPALSLKFTQALDSRFTFTRASPGTMFDAAGLLVTKSSGEPRIGAHLFTGGAWVNQGMLIEEERVWRALHNRDFTQGGSWVPTNMGTAKDATGLTGVGGSASTLTATAANATVLQTVTIASALFTSSVYIKRKTGTGNIDVTDNGGTNWTTLTGLSSSLWTRHDIKRTQANPVFGIRIVNDTDAIEVDFFGLEAGGFPTSPLAIAAAAVTRELDLAKMTGLPWWNQPAGTFVAHFNVPFNNPGGFARVFELSDGTNNNKLIIEMSGGGNVIRGIVKSNNITTAQVELSYSSGSAKMAFVYATDFSTVVLDGVAATPDTSVTPPSGLTEMNIGQSSSANQALCGFISSLEYWVPVVGTGKLQTWTAGS